MGKAADDFKSHLEWRKLANQAVGDPAVVAAKAAAGAAKTDLEKRAKLKIYYNLYYGRMGSFAATPELKAYVEGMKAAHLAVLAQPRVRPTPTPAKSPGHQVNDLTSFFFSYMHGLPAFSTVC